MQDYPLDLDLLKVLSSMPPTADGRSATQEILECFMITCASTVQEIGQALDGAELDSSLRLAHRLKGSAASLGAKQISILCHRIETFAKVQDFPGARKTFAALLAESERVKQIIESDWLRAGAAKD